MLGLYQRKMQILWGGSILIMQNSMNKHSFFDRQERIEWWDQSRLYQAKILVVGAGALGNEVLKNLALLGIGKILLIDFDDIEDSNLSRSVLFRSTDAAEGASKAHMAAKRTLELNPNPNAVVRSIHGNVVWELGAGVYRQVDIVLGCLDNLEARLAVNLNAWQSGTPWIDGGMWELSGNIAVFNNTPETACYECNINDEDYKRARIRYSCTNETVKTRIRQGQEPTTQTTSAVIAAIQTQEAIKLLHDIPSFPGRRLVFNGTNHFYTDTDFSPIVMNEVPVNPHCLCHNEPPWQNIVPLPEAKAEYTTARQLLTMVETTTGQTNLTLDIGRTFIIGAVCHQCDRYTKIHRPRYLVRDVDTVCPTCEIRCPTCGHVSIGHPDCPNCEQPDIYEPRLETLHTLNISHDISQPFLDATLAELGIPPLHILNVSTEQGEVFLIELTGDSESLWN